MWFFKRDKFKKLKREDVVSSICELETKEAKLEEELLEKEKKIEELLERGRKEKSKDMRLFLAKKVTMLREEKQREIKQCLYLMYNIKLAKRLKDAIDDNQFVVDTGKVALRDLLGDQKGLAKFLNKALRTKVADEEILTSADETFNEIEGSYVESEAIYGVQENDDAMLAMFETADGLADELPQEEVVDEVKAKENDAQENS